MTRYTNAHRTSSARKPLTIAAASVLTVGALAGAGVAGASAATPAASTTVQAGTQGDAQGAGSVSGLLSQVRAAFGTGQNDGGSQSGAADHVDAAKAKALATKLVNNQELFSRLPAPLQTDLKALASSASPQDATTLAQKIRTTALDGGYGDQVKKVASHLFGPQKNSTDQAGKSLLSDLKAAAGQDQQAAEAAQRLAKKAVAAPQLLDRLPDNLKTDLTALANATGSDVATQAQKLKSTALTGGYGQRIQQLVQHLQALAGSGTSDGADNSGAAAGTSGTSGASTAPSDTPTSPANTGVGATTGS